MKEKIINIFLIINRNNNVEFLKAKCHEMEGTDKAKLKFLKNSAENDLKTAEVFELPVIYRNINEDEELKSIPHSEFDSMNADDKFFEEIYNKFGLSETPLRVITPIGDGKIKIQTRAYHDKYGKYIFLKKKLETEVEKLNLKPLILFFRDYVLEEFDGTNLYGNEVIRDIPTLIEKITTFEGWQLYAKIYEKNQDPLGLYAMTSIHEFLKKYDSKWYKEEFDKKIK